MNKLISRLASLALALAAALCLSLRAPALAYGFPDVPNGHWAYDAIMACLEQGTVTGFEDGTFRPGDTVTSVQLAVMLIRAFYAEQAAASVAREAWYAPYIRAAEDVGIFVEAAGDHPVSRYEMAGMLYSVMRDKGVTRRVVGEDLSAAGLSMRDWETVPDGDMLPVQYCAALGIVTGMPDGAFSGAQTVDRAQACAVIVRMEDLIARDGKLANGTDCTVGNVSAILAEIQEEYPQGTTWTAPGAAGNNWYKDPYGDDVRRLSIDGKSLQTQISLQYACGGFAAMVTERIWGKSGFPFREVTDAAGIRPGDIIIDLAPDGTVRHVAVARAAAVRTDGGQYEIAICDGNRNAAVYWDRSCSLTDIGPGTAARVFTRYPDEWKGGPHELEDPQKI